MVLDWQGPRGFLDRIAGMNREPPILKGDRVLLRMATVSDVPAILGYYRRNHAYFEPTDPKRPKDFHTSESWTKRVERLAAEFQTDKSLRLFVFRTDDDARVIGTVGFSDFVRGPLQACLLGYALDEHEQGKGLMYEALSLALRYVFVELNMHRVAAGYLPTNERSGRVLRRLGFVVEGYARDFLQINGRWEDHILTSLVNPDWKPRGEQQ